MITIFEVVDKGSIPFTSKINNMTQLDLISFFSAIFYSLEFFIFCLFIISTYVLFSYLSYFNFLISKINLVKQLQAQNIWLLLASE